MKKNIYNLQIVPPPEPHLAEVPSLEELQRDAGMFQVRLTLPYLTNSRVEEVGLRPTEGLVTVTVSLVETFPNEYFFFGYCNMPESHTVRGFYDAEKRTGYLDVLRDS